MLSTDIQAVIKYLNFSALLIGLFAFIDFIIRFKRPLNFKICFSALLFSLLFLDFLLWIDYPFIDIVKFSPLINFGIWGAGLYTLSILTNGKIEKWVWWSSLVIFLLNLYNFGVLLTNTKSLDSNYTIFTMRLNKPDIVIQITRFLQRFIMIVSILNCIRILERIE